MHDTKENIQKILHESIDSTPARASVYFKTGPGEYSEFDKFLGLRRPTLKKIAKEHLNLPLEVTAEFLDSEFNEERLFALTILVMQYSKADEAGKEKIYQFYLKNIKHVNNWNLVDNSAHYIVGAHLWSRDRTILLKLAESQDLWERRIAIVATWYFIKQQDFNDTIKIVTMLMHDTEDLLHKACGWMLREVGKQQVSTLNDFLDSYCTRMPRVMLRYAIERFPENERKAYLNK